MRPIIFICMMMIVCLVFHSVVLHLVVCLYCCFCSSPYFVYITIVFRSFVSSFCLNGRHFHYFVVLSRFVSVAFDFLIWSNFNFFIFVLSPCLNCHCFIIFSSPCFLFFSNWQFYYFLLFLSLFKFSCL